MYSVHSESHRSDRIGWLRAAVLGANDGTISIASLMVGVSAAGASRESILLTGVSGLVAGAMSMAAGEYVSVQSQADTEHADLARERRELLEQPEREREELASIYRARGLDSALASQVADKLMATNALEAHARDELGITEALRARPLQAAFASAMSFVAGGVVPVVTVLLAPREWATELSTAAALLTLCALGATAAHAGGAPIRQGALRVVFWGAMAMGLTASVGHLFGTAL